MSSRVFLPHGRFSRYPQLWEWQRGSARAASMFETQEQATQYSLLPGLLVAKQGKQTHVSLPVFFFLIVLLLRLGQWRFGTALRGHGPQAPNRTAPTVYLYCRLFNYAYMQHLRSRTQIVVRLHCKLPQDLGKEGTLPFAKRPSHRPGHVRSALNLWVRTTGLPARHLGRKLSRRMLSSVQAAVLQKPWKLRGLVYKGLGQPPYQRLQRSATTCQTAWTRVNWPSL